jgi:hypothetical protein
MQQFRLVTWVCAGFALLTAGAAAGAVPSSPGARAASSPIAANAGPHRGPAGPLLADGQRAGDLWVWLSSSPAQPVEGNAQLDVFVTNRVGEPISGLQITFDADMTNMNHGLYLVATEPAEAGHYVGNMHFSMPGPWRVIAIIECPGRQTVRLPFEFRVESNQETGS